MVSNIPKSFFFSMHFFNLASSGASEIVWKQLGTTGKNNLFYCRATARHYQMWAFSPTNLKVVFKKLFPIVLVEAAFISTRNKSREHGNEYKQRKKPFHQCHADCRKSHPHALRCLRRKTFTSPTATARYKNANCQRP